MSLFLLFGTQNLSIIDTSSNPAEVIVPKATPPSSDRVIYFRMPVTGNLFIQAVAPGGNGGTP